MVGDGGFSMLTAVFHGRNVKVMVLNNDAYGEVKFEQRKIGNPEYGCALGQIDFATYAEAVGARGVRASTPADLGPAILGPAILGPAMRAWLAAPARWCRTFRWTRRKERRSPST